MNTSAADVIVVGAGPVGLTLAALLGRRGWRVVVLERHSLPYGRPRAVHLDHQAARILQAAGAMPGLAGRFEPMDAYEWRDARGATLLRLEPVTGPALSGWPASLMVAQPDVEAALTATVAKLPTISIQRQLTVEGLEPVADGVIARCQGGTMRRGRWLVGCDGAASAIRTALGVSMEEIEEPGDWLVVDLLPARPHRWSPLNLQICDPQRPTTAVSGGPGRRRFEFMRLPGEQRDELERPETVWRLLARWGYDPANAALERHSLYTFRGAVAEHWTKGHVALAGDAAHQLPPFAGQGLCSGLRDAASLAWRLDLALAGGAPDALVATYPAERVPQVREELAFSADLGRVVCLLDPATAATRNETMAKAADSGPIPIPENPPIGPGVTLAGDPHGGHLGLQAEVAYQGRRGLADTVMGGGWTLIGRDLPVLDTVPARWWTGLGGRLWAIDGDPSATDVTNAYGQWLDALGAAAVLIRPDFAVFGTAADPAGATGLVTALRRALCGPLY